jgi:hypothetical protein
MDLNLLQLRAIRLVEAFLSSIEASPASFVAYIRSIAEERFQEGYFLEEIQTALNLLSERVWETVSREAPARARVAMLGRVTAILGAAKDALARVYTRKLEHAESRIRRLEKERSELFSGTVSPPDPDSRLF